MEVIVIGAGIGGILGALTMKSLGYDVFVFEKRCKNRGVCYNLCEGGL